MANIHETLKQLEISAGGPGSGRHPGVSDGMHSTLINQGFKQGKKQGTYTHPSGSKVTVSNKSEWKHTDPKGENFSGKGPADFNAHYVFPEKGLSKI